MKIALQLYTVRDCIHNQETLFAALETLSTAGYNGVEFAGFYGVGAPELAAKLKALSLTPVCCHIGEAELLRMDATLSYLRQIGCPAVALAYSDTSTKTKLASTCASITVAAEQAKKAGISFYYHNHDHEFAVTEGVMPIEQIAACCGLELDTFWCFAAGHDPAAYLREHTANIGLIHIKDGTKATRHPCALGEGENNIAAIVAAAKELSHEWLIVENDHPQPDGISDALRSLAYLKTVSLGGL